MKRPISQGQRPFNPLSPQRIDQILRSPSRPLPFDEPTQALAAPTSAPPQTTLHRICEYDSLDPVSQLRTFVAFLRSVQARYNDNFRVVGECDLQGQDLLHKIEMADDMDVLHGYRIHKKLRDVRRERRVCKNENDLLRPLYAYLEKHDDLIPQLERLQGEIGQLKSAIDDRKYAVRTNVLKDDSEV